jgi:hypothetical protein
LLNIAEALREPSAAWDMSIMTPGDVIKVVADVIDKEETSSKDIALKDKRDVLATPAEFCEAYLGFPKLYPWQIETLNPFMDTTGNIIPSSASTVPSSWTFGGVDWKTINPAWAAFPGRRLFKQLAAGRQSFLVFQAEQREAIMVGMQRFRFRSSNEIMESGWMPCAHNHITLQ